MRLNILVFLFVHLINLNAQDSLRAKQYDACMAGQESVTAENMKCTFVSKGQYPNSCYSYGAVGLFQRAIDKSKDYSQSTPPRLSRECSALAYLADQLGSMSEEKWNSYKRVIMNGKILPLGRDDLMLDWILKHPSLPIEADCNEAFISRSVSILQNIINENTSNVAKTKVQAALKEQVAKLKHYTPALLNKNLHYRVHAWFNQIKLKNPSADYCPEQTSMLKHYLCAQIPLSMFFIKSGGCTTEDKHNGKCEESYDIHTPHVSIAFALDYENSTLNYVESENREGLNPNLGLFGTFKLAEACRITRLTALLNYEDKVFLEYLEKSRALKLEGLNTSHTVEYVISESQQKQAEDEKPNNGRRKRNHPLR